MKKSDAKQAHNLRRQFTYEVNVFDYCNRIPGHRQNYVIWFKRGFPVEIEKNLYCNLASNVVLQPLCHMKSFKHALFWL